jgi:hypothetical protein
LKLEILTSRDSSIWLFAHHTQIRVIDAQEVFQQRVDFGNGTLDDVVRLQINKVNVLAFKISGHGSRQYEEMYGQLCYI